VTKCLTSGAPRAKDAAPVVTAAPERRAPRDRLADVEWVPGGAFVMGSDKHYPEEGPAHEVVVDGFWMDRYPVTNDQFKGFVQATGYVTVAERALDPETYPGVAPKALVPGSAVFRKPTGPVDLSGPASWWEYAPGANWRDPEGSGSPIETRGSHPVVHVCHEDATAYAQWAGKRLPTEAEWERAARGGLDEREFCWGDEFEPGGAVMANVWNGEFPWEDRKSGRAGTTPVGCYPPNGFGLFDMAGNVWEWTNDLFSPRHSEVARRTAPSACCSVPRNPSGPVAASVDPASPRIPLRVLKGGSFLCAENYCMRYRPAARTPQASDSGTVHIGFRCVHN
jgi:sulfatase modifying factor 1